MGLHIEFIRVCLGKAPYFPKPPSPVICILIVCAFTSSSAIAQLSDRNIMTLMMPVIHLFSSFALSFCCWHFYFYSFSVFSSVFSLPSITSLHISSLFDPDEHTDMKVCD